MGFCAKDAHRAAAVTRARCCAAVHAVHAGVRVEPVGREDATRRHPKRHHAVLVLGLSSGRGRSTPGRESAHVMLFCGQSVDFCRNQGNVGRSAILGDPANLAFPERKTCEIQPCVRKSAYNAAPFRSLQDTGKGKDGTCTLNGRRLQGRTSYRSGQSWQVDGTGAKAGVKRGNQKWRFDTGRGRK
eukprot:6213312-Pleurochrysis_carterae.AAC.2